MMRRSISLSVNGKYECVAIEPNTLLIDLVRDELGLTAAQNTCDGEICGVCLLLLDGRPVHGCGVLAMTVEGRAVRTAEGLDAGHLVRRAFAEHGVASCERCASAMLLASVALLENNPRPTREDVKRSLSGIACPCGGYAAVIEAILHVARGSGEGRQIAVVRPGLTARNPIAEPGSLVLQQAIDSMAERLGMDPVAFHLANLPAGGGEDFAACLRLGAERIGWVGKWGGWQRPPSGRYRSGIGMSSIFGADAHAVFAEVVVDTETGSVMLSAVASAHVIGVADEEGETRRALERDLIQRIGLTFCEGAGHARLPTSLDVPEADFAFVRSEAAPVACPTLSEFPAAVVNAVRDAAGIRLRALPVHAGAVLPELIRATFQPDRQMQNEE